MLVQILVLIWPSRGLTQEGERANVGAGSNLPIDQSHVNPGFYHREPVFQFSARKLGHLWRPASGYDSEAKGKLQVFTASQPDQ
jgi:hypothetical protein